MGQQAREQPRGFKVRSADGCRASEQYDLLFGLYLSFFTCDFFCLFVSFWGGLFVCLFVCFLPAIPLSVGMKQCLDADSC